MKDSKKSSAISDEEYQDIARISHGELISGFQDFFIAYQAKNTDERTCAASDALITGIVVGLMEILWRVSLEEERTRDSIMEVYQDIGSKCLDFVISEEKSKQH